MQFRLKGVRDENPNAPNGKFSKFHANDKKLANFLGKYGADARLVIMIRDKAYVGNIEHLNDQ